MRKSILGVAASAAALGGVVGFAPTAAAEPNPPGCEKGYFCAWDANGNRTLHTAGNWSGQAAFVRVFNNGYSFPGADHVDLTYWYEGDATATSCFHYNPGPGQYQWNAPRQLVAYSVRWRGEC